MNPGRKLALRAVLAVTAVAVVAGVSASRDAVAAGPWVLDDSHDPFSDQRVVRAIGQTDAGDELSVTCDENLALVTVFEPAREIRGEELTVRYRVDDNPPVDSVLAWENFNGRARAVLVSKTSLFGDRSLSEQVDEFRLFGAQLMAGGRVVLEAGGEQAVFRLTRSGAALDAVFAACEIALEVTEE